MLGSAGQFSSPGDNRMRLAPEAALTRPGFPDGREARSFAEQPVPGVRRSCHSHSPSIWEKLRSCALRPITTVDQSPESKKGAMMPRFWKNGDRPDRDGSTAHRFIVTAGGAMLALVLSLVTAGSAFAWTCNGQGCGCYVPPSSPFGTFGALDYQTINGDGKSHVCFGGDTGCLFGDCINRFDPYPCTTSCPVDGQKRICIYNQAWTQRPTFSGGAPTFVANADGTSGGIRGSFTYEFDSMYSGIYDGTCGDSFFNLEARVGTGAWNVMQPQWERGAWTPTLPVCKSSSAQTLQVSYRARVNAVSFGCFSCDLSVTLGPFSVEIPALDEPTPGVCSVVPDTDPCCGPGPGGFVNPSSGDLSHEETDARIDEPAGPPLVFRRTYHSSNAVVGPMGLGWTHPWASKISLFIAGSSSRPQVLEHLTADGRRFFFTGRINGTAPGIYDLFQPFELVATLVETGTEYQITDLDGTVTRFDQTASGRWKSTTDRFGNALTATYTGSDLTRVASSLARGFTLAYTGGRLTSVTDDAGNQWRYAYTGGLLTGVFGPENASATPNISYVHATDPAPGTAQHLVQIKDSGGDVVEGFEYDSTGRVIKRFSGGASYGTSTSGQVTLEYPTAILHPGQTIATRVIDRTLPLSQTSTFSWTYQGGRGLVTALSGFCPDCPVPANVQKLYDTSNRVIREIDGEGRITDFTWDANGLEATRREAVGTPLERLTGTFRTYGAWPSFVTRIEQPSIVKFGQLKVTTRALSGGETTLTESVAAYILPADVSPTTFTTTTTFDSRHRVLSFDGPRSPEADVETRTYYPDADPLANRGRLQTLTRPPSITASYASYDIVGNAKTLTNPNGVVTTLVTDERGRVESSTTEGDAIYVDPLTTITVWNADNQIESLTLPKGNTIQYGYDAIGRATSYERRPDTVTPGEKKITAFNDASLVTTEEYREPDNTLRWTRTLSYFSSGLLSTITYPGGATEAFTYDSDGAQETFKDARHASPNVTYLYDQLGRLRQVDQVLGAGFTSTAYEYDAHDGLKKITDPNGNQTFYTQDDFGRTRTIQSPATGLTTRTHDAAGNVLTETDSLGVTVTKTYDAGGRMTSEVFPNPTENATYVYDETPPTAWYGIGFLTSNSDPSGVTRIDRERRGLLFQERRTVGADSWTATYDSDFNGNTKAITYASGTRYDFTHDGSDRLKSITRNSDALAILSNVAYRPFGPETSWTYGNGLTETRGWDQRYFPTSQVVSGGILDHTMVCDNDGNVNTRTDNLIPANSRTNTFDDLGRQTGASGPWGAGGFTYDPLNRQSKTAGAQTPNYFYTAGGVLLDNATGAEAEDFNHDARGQMNLQGARAYGFSQRHQLETIDEGAEGRFTHAPTGFRTKTEYQGDTRHFFFAPSGELLSWWDGYRWIDYLWLNGKPVAQMLGGGDVTIGNALRATHDPTDVILNWTAPSSGLHIRRGVIPTWSSSTDLTPGGFAGTTYPDAGIYGSGTNYWYRIFERKPPAVEYIHTNRVGLPIRITNSAGALAWQGEELPFGDFWSQSGTSSTRLRFPGQFAEDVGLFENVFRVMDSRLGRYLQADSIDLREPNLYAYVGNNPLTFVDPLGLDRQCVTPNSFNYAGPLALLHRLQRYNRDPQYWNLFWYDLTCEDCDEVTNIAVASSPNLAFSPGLRALYALMNPAIAFEEWIKPNSHKRVGVSVQTRFAGWSGPSAFADQGQNILVCYDCQERE